LGPDDWKSIAYILAGIVQTGTLAIIRYFVRENKDLREHLDKVNQANADFVSEALKGSKR
jgi:hypothetical protein